MKIQISQKSPKVDALCIFVLEKFAKKSYGTILTDGLAKQITARMTAKDFTGKAKEVLQVFSSDQKAPKHFLVGGGDKCSALDLRKAAAKAIRAAKGAKATKIAFIVPKELDLNEVILGAGLGNYTFKVGNIKDQTVVKNLTIVSAEKPAKGAFDNAISLAESINLTRDLVNLPTNLMTPEILTERAKAITKGLKNPLKITVLDKKKITKLGMGGILAVSQGSVSEPKVIVFEYNGDKKSAEKIALVGKGVCFDSGGYNLKPTSGILTMKMDMGGAATVLGVLDWVAKTKPTKNIVGIIGLVENMVSGAAYRPGDIITMMNGQTCKITNTDAEGRLVLADCLHYVTTKYKPAKVMDFATLTGACIAALGHEITGLVTNDQKYCDSVKKSAEKMSEEVWQLPLTPLFREKIKETEADLQNWTAGVSAGTSMAGAFLENFINETSWVHYDIAGTAYAESAGNELHPKGATGDMVATVTNWLEN